MGSVKDSFMNTDTAPLVSVIIPVHEHAEELVVCLKSLEKQTYQPIEIVIVDDGSTDHPMERLSRETFGLTYESMILEKNSGAPVARNEGFKRSHGTFVLFLDADTVMPPNAIAEMVRALEAHPDVAFVYSELFYGWKRFPVVPFDADKLRKMNYIDTSSMLRRDAFPGFDPSLKKFNDWDVWLTVVERGGKGFAIDQPLIHKATRMNHYSRWLPSIVHRLPWPVFGWMPSEVWRYRQAKAIIQQKHGL